MKNGLREVYDIARYLLGVDADGLSNGKAVV